jgi:hypothetical protein
MAAVVPLWQLEEWQKRREQFFAAVEEVQQHNQKVKPEVMEKEVREAIRAVRTKASRRLEIPQRQPKPSTDEGFGEHIFETNPHPG